MDTKKKMSPGCLVALIIGACVLAVVLLHLAVAYYFMRAKFQLHEVEFSDEAPADAPVEPTASSDSPPS
jgi:hypothetical protein